MSKKILEIACFNLESALIAQSAGADRIELCVDYSSGGLSPDIELVKRALKTIHIPLHVIVRSRAGDFSYNESELQQMADFTTLCNLAGVKGIVFGALKKDGNIDFEACKAIKKVAGSMWLTFHRAIDECFDIKQGLSDVISLGFHRVLTSGGKPNALEGLQTIKQLQTEFGDKIVIMPGGGVRSNNIQELLDTGCSEFHSAAITGTDVSPDSNEIKNLKQFL